MCWVEITSILLSHCKVLSSLPSSKVQWSWQSTRNNGDRLRHRSLDPWAVAVYTIRLREGTTTLKGLLSTTQILAAHSYFQALFFTYHQPTTGLAMTNHILWFWKWRKRTCVWFSYRNSMFEKQFLQPFNSEFVSHVTVGIILSIQNGRMSTCCSFPLLPWTLKMIETILNKLIIPVEHKKYCTLWTSNYDEFLKEGRQTVSYWRMDP